MSHIIRFDNQDYECQDNQTLLDCLINHNVTIPHSCKAGACQSCMMQVVEGTLPPTSQSSLKASWKDLGLFLSCQCTPTEALTVQLPKEAGLTIEAKIKSMSYLNHNVMCLVLESDGSLSCKPGQYLTLINSYGTARSYSIANNPSKEKKIEFHIRLNPGGVMSSWLENEAKIDDLVTLQGPAGDCYYTASEENLSEQTLILAGTGTGLAPLHGIIYDALDNDHKGDIILYHGSLVEDDLYHTEKLMRLDESSERFSYFPCVFHGEAGKSYQTGNIEDIVLKNLPTTKENTILYLCGTPEFVNSLKTKAFIAGISNKNIYADAFLKSK